MPIEYEIDRRRRLVHTRAWAELTDEEALTHQRRLKSDSEFDPGFRQLLDFTAVEHFGVTPEGIHKLASGDPWGAGARRAFVAPGDLAFGMLRMHEFLMGDESQELAVFRSAREAWDWLGSEPDEPD